MLATTGISIRRREGHNLTKTNKVSVHVIYFTIPLVDVPKTLAYRRFNLRKFRKLSHVFP
jgi:hypothetical protein